jgi:thiol:disulfide interchange protein DsbC
MSRMQEKFRISVFRLFAATLFTLGAFYPAASSAQQEAIVKQLAESRLGGKIDGVAKTPYLGLYEIRAGRQVFYTDEGVSYIFVGSIIDPETGQNLTDRISWKDLPLADAIKTVRGRGTRQVAVFADPNCSFCKRFEQQLQAMSDVTIYTFLFPILAEDSYDKSRAIWCAKDRSKAYYDLMLKGVAPPASPSCATPLDRNLDLGKQLRVDGTPTSFVPSGQRISGARFDVVQRALEKPPR